MSNSVTLWTVAHQVPLTVEFFRQKEWVAIPFPRGSSWPRGWTQVSCIAGTFFSIWATREALAYCELATKVQLVKNTVSVTSQYLWSAIKQSTIKWGLPVVHSEDFLLITPPSFRLQLPGGVHSGGRGRQSAPGQLRSSVWIQMGGSQDGWGGPLLEVCG